MPLYEYRCEACGAKEEKLQGISAPTSHPCPQCGAEAGMQRQISQAAFVLSGSGWYASGYGEGKEAKPKTVEASAAEGTATEAPAPAAKAPSCATGCACHSPKAE